MVTASKLSLWLRHCLLLLALLTVLVSNGLHIAVLQGYGWTRMYSEYSKLLPQKDALDLALSGKELCGICLDVQDLNTAHNELLTNWEQTGKVSLMLLFLALVITQVTPRGISLANEAARWSRRKISPPTPPPKLSFS